MNRYASLALALGAVTFVAACGDKTTQNITAPTTGANVKFSNFGVGAPAVNFYAGTTKTTAISSTSCQPPNDTTTVCRTNGVESTTGTAYNAIGSGGLYNQVDPGTVTLASKIAAATDNGLAVSSVSATLEAGKFYSYFISGVYDPVAKKADAFLVEDQIPAVDYTQAYARAVNTIAATQGLTIAAKNQATSAVVTIGTPLAYKTATSFVPLPAGVYDLTVSGTGITTFTVTSISFVAGHSYTVAARGDPNSSVTANRPGVTVVANR